LGTVLIVTADADEVVGFHLREGIFYRGKSSKANLFRFTQVPLELSELNFLLMGLPPVEIQGNWEGEIDSISRMLPGGGWEEVTFHRESRLPTGWKRSDPDGNVDLSAVFSDFSSTPSGPFPLKISVESNVQEQRLEIRYQDPEINASLPLSLFVQQKPSTAREIHLDSLGG
jgi:hypothetical protein